jgi:hypothetical protein
MLERRANLNFKASTTIAGEASWLFDFNSTDFFQKQNGGTWDAAVCRPTLWQ